MFFDLTIGQKLILLKKLKGSGGSIQTLTGDLPQTISNALAKAIRSLTQYGLCTQASTPTPDNPVDIVCNNGTLTMVDDELPIGYKRIASIKFDGDIYYETGEALSGGDDVTMTLDGTSTTGQNIFGSYNGTGSGAVNFSLFIYGGGSSSNSYFRYGDQLLRPRFGSGERTITFGKSGTDGFLTDATATPDTFTTPANAYIGMLPNSTSPPYTGTIVGNITVGTRLKWIPCERESDGAVGYYEAVNGKFIAPTGTGTPTKGAYDYTHAHLEVVGTPEVLAVAAASDPRLPKGYTPLEYVENAGTGYIDTGIVLNTVDLDVEIDLQFTGDTSGQPKMAWGYMGRAQNLPRWGFGVYDGKWLGSPNGTASAGNADAGRHTAVMRVYYSGDTARYSGTLDGDELYATNSLGNVSFFLENELPVFLFARNNNGTAGNNFVGKIYGFKVTKADVVIHDLIPCKNDSDVIGFYDIKTETFTGAIGTLTGEVKYTTVGTASVADLYAVGDYKDTQEIIGGVVTRRVGIKVLDGTESGWALSDSGGTHRFRGVKPTDSHTPSSGRVPIASTHFVYANAGNTLGGMFIGASQYWYFIPTDQTIDTVDGWKAWLAAQYAAGTPVIVLYPLAEETTESVQGQALQTEKGTNVVSATAEVSPISVEIEYTGS